MYVNMAARRLMIHCLEMDLWVYESGILSFLYLVRDDMK